MKPQDLSPKLSNLFCELKLDRVNKEYDLIESKYNKINDMFNLSGDEKTNAAIATAYTQFYKDADKFFQTLDFAQQQVKRYYLLLNIQLTASACSRKICEKKIDKTTSTEWLKDTGTLAQYCQNIDLISSQFTCTKQRVRDLLDRIRTGIKCTEEQLNLEEIKLAEYTSRISQATQELDYFTYNKDNLNPYGSAVMLRFLNSNLYDMNKELLSKFIDIIKQGVWFEDRMYNTKSKEKKGELKEKFEKTNNIAKHYKDLCDKCENLLLHPMLKGITVTELFKN